jgi:hypothetical protein
MAMLTSVEEMIARFGIPDEDTTLVKLVYSLEAATARLESELRTEFAYATGLVDRFKTPTPGSASSDASGRLFLKLSRGFVKGGSVVVRASYDLDLLEDAPAITGKYVEPFLEKGLVKISPKFTEDYVLSVYRGMPVRSMYYLYVEYDAGLQLIADQYGSVYQGVPGWLKELAMQLSYMLHKQSLDCDSSKGKAGVSGNSWSPFSCLLQSHVRYLPYAVSPL